MGIETDRCLGVWTYGRTDRWRDGQTDGLKDRETDKVGFVRGLLDLRQGPLLKGKAQYS